MKIRFSYCLLLLIFLLASCSVTKFVPEGEYLLDKIEIKSESQKVKKEDLQKYVRQTPNSSVFGIWRMQLRIYSTAGRDSTKLLNRALMRAGEAPVIYNPTMTFLSEQHLKKALENKGYRQASVHSDVSFNKKKAKVSYYITENYPYRIRDYQVEVPDSTFTEVASDSVNSLVKEDMLFDVDMLDAERERISQNLRQQGYYKFNKELISYTADSALLSNRVDITMKLAELDEKAADSIQQVIFSKYYIRNIVYFTSRNVGVGAVQRNRDNYIRYEEGNYRLVAEDNFIKFKTLMDNTFILPEATYSDNAVERTYSALNALPSVKYININFREVPGDSLDCIITVAPAKFVSLSAELEATYTDGYWGIATNLSTVHRNMFRGAESFTLQGRLAFEKQGDVFAREIGGQAGLLFPNFLMPFTTAKFRRSIRANTQFNASINFQDRPQEFTVMNVGASVKYGWTHTRFRHTLELLDLSYVDFNITDIFWNNFLETNKFNKYNYTDHVVTRIGYIGSYSNYNPNQPMRNHYSMRYSVETAGNMLYAINSIFGGKRNQDSIFTVLKIPYSQYARADFNITYHQIVDASNRFVYHIGIGVGVPYGNSKSQLPIPYERRYFSGGANSVRGWGESMLGPGVYKRGESSKGRDYNQVGDIKLDLNAEYRYKMFRSVDGAIFVDAGNVWTAKEYNTQPGGEFKFNSFLKQLAVSYGTGIRLDLSFIVVRLDMGIKLYDPTLLRSDKWRTKFKSSDFAFHFAIGYPF